MPITYLNKEEAELIVNALEYAQDQIPLKYESVFLSIFKKLKVKYKITFVMPMLDRQGRR